MISLNKALRVTKVNDGWASRIESDRFLNPLSATCSKWNGYDLTGREVNENSFYTKDRGCNSAIDRVSVENSHRPHYAGYVTLNIRGLSGGSDIFTNDQNALNLRTEDVNIIASGPNYGTNIQKNIGTDSTPYFSNSIMNTQYMRNNKKGGYTSLNHSIYNKMEPFDYPPSSNDIGCNSFIWDASFDPTAQEGGNSPCGSSENYSSSNVIDCSGDVCRFR